MAGTLRTVFSPSYHPYTDPIVESECKCGPAQVFLEHNNYNIEKGSEFVGRRPEAQCGLGTTSA